MRCAVARASKGYHILNSVIYTYICQVSFHLSLKSLCHIQVNSNSPSLLSTYHSNPSVNSTLTKISSPSLQSNDATTTLTFTYRCIVPSWGIQASNLLYMIWHCAPLYDEGANFPLWQSPEREPRFCFPLQNGNGWALHCQTTVGVVGLFNAKQP